MSDPVTGPLVFEDVEIGGAVTDVVIEGGRIERVGPRGTAPDGAIVVPGRGGMLLPGLHDHHLHLLAMAARERSLDLADAGVGGPGDLDRVLRAAHLRAPEAAWIRVVGYDDAVAGPLDARRLAALAPGRPIRVQHRAGALWVLSEAALALIGAAPGAHQGLEEADGSLTGRAWRADDWLRSRLPAEAPPDLGPVGGLLASRGVVGVTDATPYEDRASWDLLAAAAGDGSLPVAVTVTGGVGLRAVVPPHPLTSGPVKVVLDDHRPPDLDQVAHWIERAHQVGRPVAIHCVTRVAAAVVVAAFDLAGAVPGDRVEHGSVLDPVVVDRLRELAVTVVTQPGFVRTRGDHYLEHVDEDDRPHLYRCRSLLAAGVAVGGSTDAPFGDPDPWAAVEAATHRRTAGGRSLGAAEAVSLDRAIGLFTSPTAVPGVPTRLAPGAPGDLCLLDRGAAAVAEAPSAVTVVATVRSGRLIHQGW